MKEKIKEFFVSLYIVFVLGGILCAVIDFIVRHISK